MPIRQLARWTMLALATIAFQTIAGAQAQNETATQFYQRYLAAFAKAKAIEDILPFMAEANRKQAEATPKEDRDKMFGLLKILSHHDVKVLKEERAADGKTILSVEGIDDDKKPGTGKVTLVKESGAWKIGEESWTTKS
jgi:uncharacterized membrane protein YqiK